MKHSAPSSAFAASSSNPKRAIRKTRKVIRSSMSSGYGSLKFLAAGKSGVVYGIDEGRVLKEYHEAHDRDVEHRAFKRLGEHPNIVKVLETTENGCLILERGQPLRQVTQQTSPIPLDAKLRWLRDAATGLCYVHQNNIIQADVGCNNMILFGECLRITDFEGCSIDGEEATSGYEWFSYPGPGISKTTDIFAFGCAVYEIITGQPPNNEHSTVHDRIRFVQQLYLANQFPDVEGLPLSELMQGCWRGTFHSMNEVLEALEILSVRLENRDSSKPGDFSSKSEIVVVNKQEDLGFKSETPPINVSEGPDLQSKNRAGNRKYSTVFWRLVQSIWR